MASDLHDDIDALARNIETTIEETEQFLNGLPEFEDRGQRARNLEQFFGQAPAHP